ncbi:(d)CMP kinase [uncultured Albimonas sp.]|uniref:(d)CMP kinase n=1 Tax=uncultured Albimonas sp. TaxID=1331701 RepID=UPI0030EE95E8|tara:strand:+ start:306 stop:938 length:633 start_codon:yes stop_codon:yes gene_type:complete
MSFTVAIDGPAAAGKGTISRALAARYGFAHLDTGLLYRATGLKALREGRGTIDAAVAIAAARALKAEDLAADGLRTGPAGEAASVVAAIPEVRKALLDFQRAFAGQPSGAVLDGRDIGTVICPDADVKLFVTASDAVRAERRHAELVRTNPAITLEEVAGDLARRDARDAQRTDAPLKPADDALLLDTTELTIDAAIAEAAGLITRKREG